MSIVRGFNHFPFIINRRQLLRMLVVSQPDMQLLAREAIAGIQELLMAAMVVNQQVASNYPWATSLLCPRKTAATDMRHASPTAKDYAQQ